MPISQAKLMSDIAEIDQKAAAEDRDDADVQDDDKDLYDTFLSDKDKQKLEAKYNKGSEAAKAKKPDEKKPKETNDAQEKPPTQSLESQDTNTEDEGDQGRTTDDEEGQDVEQDQNDETKPDANEESVRRLKELEDKITAIESEKNEHLMVVNAFREMSKDFKGFLKQNPIPGVKVLDQNEVIAEKMKALRDKYGADFVPDANKVYTPGTTDFEYKRDFDRIQREVIEEEVKSNMVAEKLINERAKLAVDSGKHLEKTLDNIKKVYKIDPDTDEALKETRDFVVQNAYNPIVLGAMIMQLKADATYGLNNKAKVREVEDGIEANKRGQHLRPSPASKTGQSKQKPTSKMERYLSDDD